MMAAAASVTQDIRFDTKISIPHMSKCNENDLYILPLSPPPTRNYFNAAFSRNIRIKCCRTREGSMSKFLAGLNKSQQKVVSHGNGPLLVLAGAGSGKTRVLTNRIARLVHEKICKPSQVVAVTFTNKASIEMQGRIAKLATTSAARAMTICTFHSLGARILREHGDAIGVRKNFTILDDHQRSAAIKEVVRSAGSVKLAEKHEEIASAISLAKNTSLDPEKYERDNPETPRFKRIFEAYRSHNIKRQTIDFDDLLLLPLQLFEQHEDILDIYRKRFSFISIDEFQDTNSVQLKMSRLMAAPANNIMAVGDDDQGIYSWRGADIENILSFKVHFPKCTTVVLDVNYRSTRPILEAALAVVERNRKRTIKSITAAEGNGEPITVYKADDETEEADWVAGSVRDNVTANRFAFKDHAILLRANAMMRRFEEAMRRAKIPYKVFGALSFFDSKEIKDVLAYLRFFANPADEISLQRVLKVPDRGIAKSTLEKLEELAGLRRIGLFEAMQHHHDVDLRQPQQHANCQAFCTFYDTYAQQFGQGNLAETIRKILAECDYLRLLQRASKTEDGAELRRENVEEILNGLSQYESRNKKTAATLSGYLQELSLVKNDEAEDDATQERGVRLMTFHKAKGLEFPVVFLCNLDDSVMPSPKTVAEGRIEEERRLFYVGMTRAKKRLLLTYPATKEFRKKIMTVTPCRFINEIPPEYLDGSFIRKHEAEKQEFMDNFFADIQKKLADQTNVPKEV
jgi:DNA helicase II / ATP-dependent DNA helicase PcrA